MCGGSKATEKKSEAPPPDLLPPEAPPEPTPEAPPVEEPPKDTKSMGKSMGSKLADSKMAAAQPSIALMTGRKGAAGPGAGMAKGPVGGESVAKGAPSLALTSSVPKQGGAQSKVMVKAK